MVPSPCHLLKHLYVARFGEVEAVLEMAQAGAPHAASLLTPSPAEKEGKSRQCHNAQ